MQRSALATVILATCLSSTLVAQGWIEPIHNTRHQSAVIRVSTAVRATIEGPIVRFEVTERYQNRGAGLAEGNYLFPIPGEAVFTDFSLFQGEQELKGEMLPAQEAQSIYEEIVRRKRDPALLSLAGHGLIRARVFPIAAGETRTVILHFTQVLRREGDALRLRYAFGRRGPTTVPVNWTVLIPDETGFGKPFSPTHRLSVTQEGRGRRVGLRNPNPVGDVDILFPTRGDRVALSWLAHAPDRRDDGYFMLVVSPPPPSNASAMARDLTIVVDISGSMAGEKLEQAKQAMHQAIRTLRPIDRFRLISFSTGIHEMRDGWSPVTSESLREASEFIDRSEARGGTNIAGALAAAAAPSAVPGRHSVMLFLTDGLPSVGERSPEAIASRVAGQIGNARLFPFGIGPDVNTYLLDRLAIDGRGAVEYVAPGEDVERAVGRVVERTSRPTLTNLRIVGAPGELHDLAPQTLPDLFAGDEVVITGRYRGRGRGRLILAGDRNGRQVEMALPVTLPAHQMGNDFIPSIWASRRIGELTTEIRLEGARPDLIARIKVLGLRYGILTPYTSYLVQEPSVVVGGDRPRPRPRTPRPGDQVGAEAVQEARESQHQRAAKSLDQSEAVVQEQLRDLAARSGGPTTEHDSRLAGRRVLVRRGVVWTDIAVQDTLEEFRIAAFSEAYFAILRALPDLGPSLHGDEEVLLAGKQVNLRIGAKGRQTLSPAEIDHLVGRFQGP